MMTGTGILIAQEWELHQLLINTVDRLPKEMLGGAERRFLAWGHELRVRDQGRTPGGDGWADILLVDECGEPWIVELKMASSAELTADVWTQLMRYRAGLREMEWADIHALADRFLEGQGDQVKPAGDSYLGCRNLEEVVENWQQRIGRATLPAGDVVAKLRSRLSSGTAGLALVVQDGFTPAEFENMRSGAQSLDHDGAVCFLSASLAGSEVEYLLHYYRPPKEQLSNQAEDAPGHTNEVFPRYSSKVKVNVTLGSFAEALHETVRSLYYDTVVPNLTRLGWTGEDAFKTERKSFHVALPVNDTLLPILRLAYSDTDSSYVPREFKISGTFGLRVDLAATHIKKSGLVERQALEDLAARLHVLGWRGTGAGANAGYSTLSDEDYEKWGFMRFWPSKERKDFLGHPKEDLVLEAFFKEIARFLDRLQHC